AAPVALPRLWCGLRAAPTAERCRWRAGLVPSQGAPDGRIARLLACRPAVQTVRPDVLPSVLLLAGHRCRRRPHRRTIGPRVSRLRPSYAAGAYAALQGSAPVEPRPEPGEAEQYQRPSEPSCRPDVGVLASGRCSRY